MFDHQSILITGGTGSLGAQLVETLLQRHQPRRVIVFSRDEYKQFQMKERAKPWVRAFQERTQTSADPMRFFIGDVRNLDRLKEAMHDVDYVIHAAALKQVDTCEYNPEECLDTNVGGARNVIAACLKKGVKKVVALSSDKAADPQNIYGTSKLMSDMLFVSANNKVGRKPTRFAVVRYGNVLGSRGSVIPFFKKMLAANQASPSPDFALPITDFEMTRFWITLQQGVDFVLKAFERMQGGEIFIPKIPSMKITEMAKSLFPNTPLKEVGLRPGEKLHEVMCPNSFSDRTIAFTDHFVITPTTNLAENINYFANALQEPGTRVSRDFEYNSHNNPDFLTDAQIRQLVDLDQLEG